MTWTVEFHPEFESEFDRAFYKQLIKKADERFDVHLASLRKGRKPK